jgi:uncharacterized protein YoxC
MSNRRDSIGDSNILKFALNFLAAHEKHMDKTVHSINLKKDVLSSDIEKLDGKMDELLRKLQQLEEDIEKVRSLL